MATIELVELTKVFPGGAIGLDHVNLTVRDGEFMVLVGPSGCGKSTLLRVVAGLEDPTSGTVIVDGQPVDSVPPRDRDMAMVFQNYALYPHMTVQRNLGFSLRVHRTDKARASAQIADVAHTLSLQNLLERKPAALSGGQRQRVAMGRAMVRQPRVMLMDEPLSNLDAKLRVAMRGELMRLHQQNKVTTLYVTHDQIEAMTLGERIAVLKAGRLQQVGTPHELYQAPANVFVAGFIGSPAMNLARGRLSTAGPDLLLELGEHRWALPAALHCRRPGLEGYAGQEITVGFRPAAFSYLEDAAAEGAVLTVQATTVESLGDEQNVLFLPPFPVPDVTDSIGDSDLSMLWTAKIDPSADVRPGKAVSLRIDLTEAYFFDAVNGLAI
jgi:multiple sugar transport system ATP-binding protein